MKSITATVLMGFALTLSGCISLQSEPPESLLTLTSSASAPAGSGAANGGEGSAGTIAVFIPEVPAKLDVVRVPVTVTDTELAYLKDAVWVERPARLFRRLLGETLRTRSGDAGAALILDTGDTPVLAERIVRGTLLDMGYDARSGEAVVRYEAILVTGEDSVVSRRFEARENVVAPEAEFVGPAINRAANKVAGEVADWVFEAG